MGALTAIMIAVFWCVTALLITGSRGYSIGGMLLCLAGIIAGGVGAGLAGKYALTGWNVIISTEREKVVACAAVFVGALCGLHVAERIRDHQFPTFRQLVAGAFGFFAGGMCAYVIFYFTLNTWAQTISLFGLIPATVATATLAGAAMGRE